MCCGLQQPAEPKKRLRERIALPRIEHSQRETSRKIRDKTSRKIRDVGRCNLLKNALIMYGRIGRAANNKNTLKRDD